MEEIRIRGNKVTLTLLSKIALETWRDDSKKAEQLFGYSIDSEEIEGNLQRAFNIKIENMNNDPGNEKWYSYFALIVDGRIIGTIGAKGKPDKDGIIEIGYGISPKYERNGYTTESVSIFCHYFFSNHLVKAIKACTDISNSASQRLLIKNGFDYLGIENGEKVYMLDNSKNDKQYEPN